MKDVGEGERTSGQRLWRGLARREGRSAWGEVGDEDEKGGAGIAAKGPHARNFGLHPGPGILNVRSWQMGTVRPAQCFKKP